MADDLDMTNDQVSDDMTEDVSSASTVEASDATTTDDFDKDRAMATIRKLREEAKQGARATRELEQLRAERKAAEDAKLSEQERLTKRAADLEAELARERQQTRDRLTSYEVKLAAQSLNIVDPEVALKLVTLEYGDDGNPVDVEGALKALIEEKPYLVRQGEPTAARPQGNPTNPATRSAPAGSRRYTAADISDRAIWNANKDDIMRALREGRVD